MSKLLRLTAIGLQALVVALLGPACSSGPTDPVADGGTHTGNPYVVAAVVMSLAGTGDEWHVDHYVDRSQLDPASIAPPVGRATAKPLAKRLAGSTTSADPAGTMLLSRQEIVVDTLYEEYVVWDTVYVDGARYVTETVVRDLVFIRDTITVVDTVLVWAPGAEGVDSLDSANAVDSGVAPSFRSEVLSPVMFCGSDYDAASRTVDYVFEQEDETWSVQAADDAYTVNVAVVSRISQVYEAGDGSVVQTSYTDRDGDDLLYTASADSVPQVRLVRTTSQSDGKVVLCTEFDAGSDGVFTTTADNTILSLFHYRLVGADTMAIASYVFSQHGSTVYGTLRVTEFPTVDTIVRVITEYNSVGGLNVSSHRLDRVAQTIFYDTDTVGSVTVVLEPRGTVTPGQNIVSAEVDAMVNLEDRSIGRLTGSIESGRLDAVYIYGSCQYRVTSGADGAISIEEINIP